MTFEKIDWTSLTNAFTGARALVVGDVMLDEYIIGDVQRISPEAPVPIVQRRRHSVVPGGAANTAANVASLGGQVVLGGVIGNDPMGAQLKQAVNQAGIDVSGVLPASDRPTTIKTRVIAHSQQLLRIDQEDSSPISTGAEDQLLAWAELWINSIDVVVLSDYGKGVLTRRLTQRMLMSAREAGKPSVVDPKGTDYSKYLGATVITPNTLEASQATGVAIRNRADLIRAGQQLLEQLPGTAILITRGPEGMSLFRQNHDPMDLPTAARHVYDVTGAGDTVVSTLAITLACGGMLDQACHVANFAAGIVVGKVGTASVTQKELTAAISAERPDH
jgi:D-beta-D-heptose 7-phosphate kinase/D-beta-D-heptose 1-phosphate adenosyltransferase